MARPSSGPLRPRRPTSTPAKRKGVPLSPLAKQMLHDMQLAGLGERTHESYLRAVRKFAQWINKSPHTATEDDLRRYLLFIKNDQQWEPNSLKAAYSGIKFFYTHTCPQDWSTLSKLRIPKQFKLPAVLTIRYPRTLQTRRLRPRSLRSFATLVLNTDVSMPTV